MIPKTSVFSERYNRQTLLPEIGLKGQERLAQSRVLIVGMGGLGCPAALYLAGAGVGHLGIVDDDRVDLSNLQRQILYKNAECGMLKVEAAQIRLLELNPEIHVTAYATRVTASNISSIFSKYDLVIDGTDNFSSKFLMNDAAVQLEIPLVYGSISRFEGHVSVFWSKHGPCYRCLYPEPPKTHIRNCEESGVLGALAGMIGSAQALEAIKIIVSEGEPKHLLKPLLGRLLTIDTSTWRISSPRMTKLNSCTVCSVPPHQIILKDRVETCAPNAVDFGTFSKQQDCIAVDVREASEWLEGHLLGAIHLPLSQIETSVETVLSKDRNYLLYCRSGARSEQALQLLISRGYTNLTHLKGGLLALNSAASLSKTDLLRKEAQVSQELERCP